MFWFFSMRDMWYMWLIDVKTVLIKDTDEIPV